MTLRAGRNAFKIYETWIRRRKPKPKCLVPDTNTLFPKIFNSHNCPCTCVNFCRYSPDKINESILMSYCEIKIRKYYARIEREKKLVRFE